MILILKIAADQSSLKLNKDPENRKSYYLWKDTFEYQEEAHFIWDHEPFTNAFIRVYLDNGNLDYNGQKSFQQILPVSQKTSIRIFGIHEPCLGLDTASVQANRVQQLYNPNLPPIFLRVQSQVSVPQCKWRDSITNCNFLMDLIRAYQNFSVQVGILTSQKEWRSIMNGDNGCPQAADYPLIYVNTDEKSNFDDWFGGQSKFGKWNEPFGKLYQKDVNIHMIFYKFPRVHIKDVKVDSILLLKAPSKMVIGKAEIL